MRGAFSMPFYRGTKHGNLKEEPSLSRKVCVVGLGLIGGSIALAIQREHDAFIIGVEVDENQLKLAESLKIIDQGTRSLAEGVCEADLIIFATPVTKTEELVESLKDEKLKPGVIITDVGSTKKKILKSPRGFKNMTLPLLAGILWQVPIKRECRRQRLTCLKMPITS